MIRTLVAILLLACLSAPALGQNTRDRSDEIPTELPDFEQADSDGDGLLSLEEAKAVGIPQSVFEAEDHNVDGLISKPTYRYALKGEMP
jgi:hypothetical protein